MRRKRQNRPRQKEDEKLVAFRMPAKRYAELKVMAARLQKPVAQFINEILDGELDELEAFLKHSPGSIDAFRQRGQTLRTLKY